MSTDYRVINFYSVLGTHYSVLIKAKHPPGRAGVWLQGRSEEPCGAKDM